MPFISNARSIVVAVIFMTLAVFVLAAGARFANAAEFPVAATANTLSAALGPTP